MPQSMPTTATITSIATEISRLKARSKLLAAKRAEKYAKKYPKSIPIKLIWAEINRDLADLKSAQKVYASALSQEPNNATIYVSLADTLMIAGKLNAAEKSLMRAQKLLPSYPETYRSQAELFMLKHEPDLAREKFETYLTLNPTRGDIHRRLSSLKHYTTDDPHIQTLKALIDNETREKETGNIANLHYAYAKAMEDIGQYEVAMSHYVAGGQIKKNIEGYQHTKSERQFESIKQKILRSKNIQVDVAEKKLPFTPIFIFGMPRSGTTLLESIVSAHTDVTAGGELNIFSAMFSKHLARTSPTNATLENIRTEYRTYCKEKNLSTHYFTDKMPQNFRYASLLSRCFPEAKIVHVSRDPRATCWSNFKHFFPADGLAYTWDIDDTVAYYNMYLDLMEFHRQHMHGEMIEIQYEDLVANPEVEIPKLIAALGLEWQDACLEPQKNKRAVRTASQMQVQKGIYKGSSDSWRKFEPFLAEAFSKLKGVPAD